MAQGERGNSAASWGEGLTMPLIRSMKPGEVAVITNSTTGAVLAQIPYAPGPNGAIVRNEIGWSIKHGRRYSFVFYGDKDIRFSVSGGNQT